MKSNANTKEKGTILVPLDYSPHSILASRYAAKIANKSGSNICFLHSFYAPAFDLVELSGGLHTQQQLRTDVTIELTESEESELLEFINKLLDYKEFSSINRSRITHELKIGLASDEIISFAKQSNPEMVIMGTRGANKKNASILGSVTENVLKKLSIPIIAIPENYKFIGEENLKTIIYLTDFDESDFMSIKKLMRFTELFNMSIHCVHISSKSDQWEGLKMDGLKDYFLKVYKNNSVKCTIVGDKPDLLSAIDKYIIDNNINLIALTHKKRKLLGKVFKPSMTKKVFYHTEIPLMVFHD